MRFFKPRYSLATILLVMTATALLLWGVPEWREFQRRKEFERAASRLSAGVEPSLFDVLPPHSHDGHLTGAVFSDADGKPVSATPIFYKRYWYCIYAHREQLSDDDKRKLAKEFLAAKRAGRAVPFNRMRSDNAWSQVRVYRLPPMPPGYKAQSKRGKQQITLHPEMKLVDREPRDQYLTDFYEILAGRETRDLGIKYELIHTDPPILEN
jgi:hypothetical protein